MLISFGFGLHSAAPKETDPPAETHNPEQGETWSSSWHRFKGSKQGMALEINECVFEWIACILFNTAKQDKIMS